MKTLDLSMSELLELRFLLEKRFEVVWNRYIYMTRSREFVDDQTISCFREDVEEIVSLLRKIKNCYLGEKL